MHKAYFLCGRASWTDQPFYAYDLEKKIHKNIPEEKIDLPTPG